MLTMQPIMWSAEKILMMIEMLHTMPSLWDSSCIDFKNKQKKMDSLQKLADTFGTDVHEIDKKIKCLKTQFRREHKKISDIKKNGTLTKKCLWFGYEPLLFLIKGQEMTECFRDEELLTDTSNPDNDTEEDHKNFEIVNEEYDSSPHCSVTLNTNVEDFSNTFRVPISSTQSNKKMKRDYVEDNRSNYDYSPMKFFDQNINQRDELTVYGEYVAIKLRGLKSHHSINIAQHYINNILFEAAMGKYEKDKFRENKNNSTSTKPNSSYNKRSSLHVDIEEIDDNDDKTSIPLLTTRK